jgi:hypothetical protein
MIAENYFDIGKTIFFFESDQEIAMVQFEEE